MPTHRCNLPRNSHFKATLKLRFAIDVPHSLDASAHQKAIHRRALGLVSRRLCRPQFKSVTKDVVQRDEDGMESFPLLFYVGPSSLWANRMAFPQFQMVAHSQDTRYNFQKCIYSKSSGKLLSWVPFLFSVLYGIPLKCEFEIPQKVQQGSQKDHLHHQNLEISLNVEWLDCRLILVVSMKEFQEK